MTSVREFLNRIPTGYHKIPCGGSCKGMFRPVPGTLAVDDGAAQVYIVCDGSGAAGYADWKAGS